jgi:hypothetical protein
MIRMRSVVVTAAATVSTTLLITACAGQLSAAPAGAGVQKPIDSDAASLLARAMQLPSVSAGSVCPVTPVAHVSTGVTDPRGKGPLYFGGPVPIGGFPFNKVVYSTVGGTHGPILLRGGRIDGARQFEVQRKPGRPDGKAEIPPPPGGKPGSGSWAFYQAVLDLGPDNALYVYPSTRGCYAIQVDAPSSSEVIVLTAT